MDFGEIYQEYFKEVYLFIKSLSHDESIAEEITQGVKGNREIRWF
ncbi:hypothetical protein [Oceanobacillus caeni]|nr:hypothetical protein [Oceanobacillus caeni]